AKVPKALRQSSNVLSHKAQPHQKNSGTLFCAAGTKLAVLLNSTKPLRFRFGNANYSILQLFF
ncbi:hypothetical protein, partial [Pedobacter sp. UBA5917]|uniref:hypothetical protein n=1 Tax=Pedobacter sp. UBA5917 TaxID=1947061 RepID=UPI0025CB7942